VQTSCQTILLPDCGPGTIFCCAFNCIAASPDGAFQVADDRAALGVGCMQGMLAVSAAGHTLHTLGDLAGCHSRHGNTGCCSCSSTLP